MNIAICDDYAEECAALETYLHSYFSATSVWTFNRGTDLVQAHEKKRFDLILVDILIPDLNGIEISERIRNYDEETPIIILADTEEFAFQSYRVRAFDYLLKPVTEEMVKQCLTRFTKQKPDKRFITVEYKGIRTDILLSNIIYMESNLRKVIFHLTEEKNLVLTAKLAHFLSLTAEPDFCRCHKSYIVNLEYVDSISKEDFWLHDGNVIRISRTFLNDARREYFNYLYRKGYGMN